MGDISWSSKHHDTPGSGASTQLEAHREQPQGVQCLAISTPAVNHGPWSSERLGTRYMAGMLAYTLFKHLLVLNPAMEC